MVVGVTVGKSKSTGKSSSSRREACAVLDAAVILLFCICLVVLSALVVGRKVPLYCVSAHHQIAYSTCCGFPTVGASSSLVLQDPPPLLQAV